MIPINRARQLIYIMESHWRSGLPLQSHVQGKRVTRLGRSGDSTSVSAGVHKYVPHQQTAGELQRAASLSLEAGEWRWGWCGCCILPPAAAAATGQIPQWGVWPRWVLSRAGSGQEREVESEGWEVGRTHRGAANQNKKSREQKEKRVSWSQDLRPSGTGGDVIIGKGGLGEETV